jgi:hypothetical protein
LYFVGQKTWERRKHCLLFSLVFQAKRRTRKWVSRVIGLFGSIRVRDVWLRPNLSSQKAGVSINVHATFSVICSQKFVHIFQNKSTLHPLDVRWRSELSFDRSGRDLKVLRFQCRSFPPNSHFLLSHSFLKKKPTKEQKR